MRTLAVLSVVLGTAFGGPKTPLPFVPDSKTALEIARTRGKLIFLTVIVDHDGENRAVVDQVFGDKQFIKMSKEFVLVYANHQNDHGQVAVRNKKGKKEPRCADCPSIRCEDHMALAQRWARGFFPGAAMCPCHFLIDGDENVVDTIYNGSWESGMNHVDPGTLVGRMKKALKKHGRGLTEAQYEQMVKDLTDARAARARGNIPLELKKLNAVVALSRKIEGVEKARKRLKEIDARAAVELKKLEALVAEEKWEEAIDGLEKIGEAYPGTLTAAAAKGKRAELLDRKEVKRLLKARDLYERGLKYKEKGKLELARKKFAQCVRRCKGTSYAELAQKQLDSMGAR